MGTPRDGIRSSPSFNKKGDPHERLHSEPPGSLTGPAQHRNYDAYYEPSGGKGLGLVVGILVAIALVAGLMFFTGPRERTDQAQLPAQERTMTRAGRPDPPAGDPAASGDSAGQSAAVSVDGQKNKKSPTAFSRGRAHRPFWFSDSFVAQARSGFIRIVSCCVQG